MTRETEAKIALDEKVVAIWYLPTMPTQDWMGCLREIEPGAQYELVYRFRYYDGDQSKGPFLDNDTKSWFRATIPASRERAIAGVRTIAKILEQTAGSRLYEFINWGDFPAFLEEFLAAPFVHSQRVPRTAN